MAEKQNSRLSLQIGGKLVDLSSPKVMKIINITDNSFYEKSRCNFSIDAAVDFIDVGGCSTKPGSEPVDENTELMRLNEGLSVLKKSHNGAIFSVDTFRPKVAAAVIETYGVSIINDVSGGSEEMFDLVADKRVPYVLTFAQGGNTSDMLFYFSQKIDALVKRGATDIILDPGFGFNKILDENYEIARNLGILRALGLPILVGVSRKSMIYNLLGITPNEALTGTIALSAHLLAQGANILRVHDEKEALEQIRIFNRIHQN